MIYSNKEKYEGTWFEDKKCGNGQMDWENEIYKGEWAENLPNGFG